MILHVKDVPKSAYRIPDLDDGRQIGSGLAQERGPLRSGSSFRISIDLGDARFLRNVCSVAQCLRSVEDFLR